MENKTREGGYEEEVCEECGGEGVVYTRAYQSQGEIVDEEDFVCICMK